MSRKIVTTVAKMSGGNTQRSGKRQVALAILIGHLAIIPAMFLLIMLTLLFQGQISTTPLELQGGSFVVSISGRLYADGFALFYGAPVI